MHFQNLAALSSFVLFSAVSIASPIASELGSSKDVGTKRSTPAVAGKVMKRAVPTIGSGIDPNDPVRGGRLTSPAGGFQNAFQLMNYAITAPDATRDPILIKYFNLDQKTIVTNVFQRLLGPTDASAGAPELAQITVIAGQPEDEDIPSQLEGYADPNPNLILSEDAWVYPDRDTNGDNCETWKEEGMTQDMYLLGSIILHEYTHWDWLLAGIHGGEVTDLGYGWAKARALDKSQAIFNADSYGWYATELLWSVLCEVPGGFKDGDDVLA